MTELPLPFLLTRSRHGDISATAEILERLSPTLQRLARRWVRSVPGYQVEDLQQEAALVALQAIQSWDGTQAPFEAWVTRLIHQGFGKLARAAGAVKRGKEATTVSLSTPVGRDPATGERLLLGDVLGDAGARDPESATLAQAELEERLAGLTRRQRQVALLLIDGYSSLDISLMLDLTPAQVSKTRQELRLRLSQENL